MPYPADYGGAIDVYNKIKALHQSGIKIHLHCYTKNRQPQPHLLEICRSVNYYRRNLWAFSFHIPYIVASRNDGMLLENIKADNFPVLLEGIHCSMLAFKNQLRGRQVLLRMHNVEYIYYEQLAQNEKNIGKKIFFYWQSRLLKNFERNMAPRVNNIAISSQDAILYQQKFHVKNMLTIPAFISWQKIEAPAGLGSFCLYHGNLSISENENAAIWLIEKVFKETNIPLVIAGKNPGARLKKMIDKNENTCLVINPSQMDMEDLIKKAQVNVLPSFNNTGVKLKLLHALFAGRHCLVNEAAVAGSGLESLCHVATDVTSFKKLIVDLFKKEFTEEALAERRILLTTLYNNQKNAEKISALIP